MSRIYLAGPLFCVAELEYNMSLKEYMAENGEELVLPQECGADIDPRMMGSPDYAFSKAKEVFGKDLGLLDSCDALVMNLDGRVPDEGACVELGYAFARGKPCFGIKTDVRAAEYGIGNMMVVGALGGKIARSREELVSMLRDAGL